MKLINTFPDIITRLFSNYTKYYRVGLYIENLTYSDIETEDNMKEQVEGYQVTGVGNVRIADDVLAVIASIATMEVDGVDSMAGNITKEIISKVSGKNLSKGVK